MYSNNHAIFDHVAINIKTFQNVQNIAQCNNKIEIEIS